MLQIFYIYSHKSLYGNQHLYLIDQWDCYWLCFSYYRYWKAQYVTKYLQQFYDNELHSFAKQYKATLAFG